MSKEPESSDDWGSFEQAERWRREAFLARSHAQRLQWLRSALRVYYAGQERTPKARDGAATKNHTAP